MQVEVVFKQHFPQMAEEITLKEIQKKVINNTLGGSNTLAILPTGGGKSLIYWVSGMELNGITIVVSPLIALIDEQVEKLREQNISVLKLHADVKQNEQIELLSNLYNGEYAPSFIFVSPERLAMDGLLEKALKKRKEDIKLVVIDEIHCISQWGESFRPLYTHIPMFLNAVFDQWPVVLGLSATLNVLEIEEIKKNFYINNQNVIKDVQLMRTEINLINKHFNNEEEKEKATQLKLFEGLNLMGFYPVSHYNNEPFKDSASAIITYFGSMLNLFPISNSQVIEVIGNDVIVC